MNDLISRSREEILREVEEKAYANEKNFHGCSQSALAALQDVFDSRDDPVFRAASGLGGGVGLTAETCCGGLSGGCMFISQLCGRERDADGSFGDKENFRFLAYKYCQLLAERFFEEYDACNCFEVQKVKTGRPFLCPGQARSVPGVYRPGRAQPRLSRSHRPVGPLAAEIILDHLEDFGLADKVELI